MAARFDSAGPNTSRSSRTPTIAAGITSVSAAPNSSRATAAAPAPQARRTAIVRRRSWTVSAHAWISAYRQTSPSTIATARTIARRIVDQRGAAGGGARGGGRRHAERAQRGADRAGSALGRQAITSTRSAVGSAASSAAAGT